MKKANSFLTVPVSIMLGSFIISISLLISGGIIKVGGITNKAIPTAVAPQAPPENTGPVKVSLDDDPVLGDKNAPVTLIDFSDYECPFCKKHFDQVYPQIKKDYIDTGKVKMVYRDLPLPFHDPNATDQAIAANCARDQGGDDTYFRYHNEIFKRTTSNKTFARENLPKIAADLGLHTANFESCLNSDKYKAEVQKDLDDASKYGASGTPTFFIGKSTGQEIDGTKIVGAQPYSVFKTIIEEQLR